MSWLMFWNHKKPEDNLWHPIPGARKIPHHAPRWLQNPWMRRLDFEALAVDVTPYVLGAGTITHVSQVNQFGFTAHASVFKNPRTLSAMHTTANYAGLLVTILQLGQYNYRQLIPRWASERERRRDEEQARSHVLTGMIIGAGIGSARAVYTFRTRGYLSLSLLEVVLGGGLADILLREYYRAHNL